jgi:putative spermidine/putrescine transport system substrate-binding protein
VVLGQAATLRTTGFGGPWGEVMVNELLPAFEKEHQCRVQIDTAYGSWIAKLQSSPRSNPIYDVFHANANEQWLAASKGLVETKIDASKVPNLADVYAFAKNDNVVGVTAFIMGIGLGYRTDKVTAKPASWKEYWNPALRRGGFDIPTHSFGQAFVMMCGSLFGSGPKDLDAAFAALERLKPIKNTNFGTAMMKLLLSNEVDICIINDGNIYRYENEPIDFSAPQEGMLANEQVYSVTTGSKQKDLANAYINFILSPLVQKRLAERLWNGPTNRNAKLEKKFEGKLITSEQEASALIYPDWRWYNSQKDRIDARVNRIFGS